MSGQIGQVFSMKQGEISQAIQAGPNGVVVKVREVQEPTDAQIKADWDKQKDALVEQKREEFENLYVENLRTTLEKDGKIKINKKEMERVSSLAGS